MKPVQAWWFAESKVLPNGDGRRIQIGRTHVHHGPLVMCKSGFHASRRVLDALNYAKGHLLYRVECSGEIKEAKDKLVCSRRTPLAMIDVGPVLRKFARLCALDVIHLWDAAPVVVQYLKTGDESLRAAASDASSVSRDAAGVTRGAIGVAVWAVRDAKEVSRDAAENAAWAAAGNAAWDARLAAGYARMAAGDAVRAKQNKRLTNMCRKAMK